MGPDIPDRWIPYKACGNEIEGTRIVCFKVPLKQYVQAKNPAVSSIWDIDALLQKVPKLGLVVDLTNTARYYDPKLLKDAGVEYKKLYMPGRIIPPDSVVIEFMDTIDNFCEKDKDAVVGVHCTHGLNRTGYMVCRYMRDRLGIEPKETIKRFEIARGYPIERKNYISSILGLPVPSAEIGPQYRKQPAYAKNSMLYRSPLEESYPTEPVDTDKPRNRLGYFNNRKRNNEYKSFNNAASKRRRSRSRDSNRSLDFDYKYDY